MAGLQITNGETAKLDDLIATFLSAIDVKPKSIETYRKAIKQFSLYISPQRNDGAD